MINVRIEVLTNTIIVASFNSCFEGQLTFFNSSFTSKINFDIFLNKFIFSKLITGPGRLELPTSGFGAQRSNQIELQA